MHANCKYCIYNLYLSSKAINMTNSFTYPRVLLFLPVKYYDKKNVEQHNTTRSCFENGELMPEVKDIVIIIAAVVVVNFKFILT